MSKNMKIGCAVLAASLLPPLILIATGCTDVVENPEPWGFGEDPASNAQTDGGPIADPPDLTEEPERPDLPGGAETPTCVDADLELFAVNTSGRDRHIVVSGDRVFVSGYLQGHADTDVLEWDGRELIGFDVRNESNDIPIDAADGKLWTAGAGFLRYDLERESDPFELMLAAAVPPRPSFFAPPRRHTNGDQFAWRTGTSIYLLVDGSEVLGYEGAQSGPWVGRDGMTWFGHADEQWHIHFTDYTGFDQDLELGTDYGAWPVTVETTVVYLRNGEVWSWDTETGETDPIIEGLHCGPLYSSGDTVVTACTHDVREGTPVGTHYLDIDARDVWTIDASLTAEMVYESSEYGVVNPVVNDHWVAWLEYAPETNEEQLPTGNVVVMPRAGEPNSALRAARISGGCWTCGAYWPPPLLDIDEDTLAFNYAVGPNDPPIAPTNDPVALVGVLRLSPNCE